MALLLSAAWLRLAAPGEAVPEACTLPVTVPLLAIGLFRRRRSAAVSSWAAHGTGTALAVTLLPSALRMWGGGGWERPLLLGLAALGLTLLGAWYRSRRPCCREAPRSPRSRSTSWLPTSRSWPARCRVGCRPRRSDCCCRRDL
ncbi:SCO7613 C-terminal domain-containing membrane protein [Streptomyces sp. TP-A0874]|uniref:SCO7613 C-terminal domain-containing membrane protein n=1 Tax=Streptomyces sp. TP-A0874 TaxID=549819 RepID=UPI0008537D1B